MKPSLLLHLFIGLIATSLAHAGNWQVIASPNASKNPNELHAVAAVSENDVWAVGTSYLNTGFTQSLTLIEHWNGTSWSIVPSPNVNPTLNILNGVAVVSANDIWAVGFGGNTFTNSSLILHWNGTAWSVVPGPNTTMPINNLAAIAVISANDIWAVGTGRIADEDATITIHWDGSVWNLVPSPNAGHEINSTLAGVAAVSTNDVWAVGTQQPTSLTDPHTLILHWNGVDWKIVTSPNDGGSNVDNHLLAATAVSANDVWAVGFSGFGALTEHWNGSAWSVVPTPLVSGSEFTTLSGAVAFDNGSVWSVGSYFQTQFSRSRTLTEFWNGSSWSVVRSVNKGSSHNSLVAINSTPGGTLWAVGNIYSYPSEKTLVLRKTP